MLHGRNLDTFTLLYLISTNVNIKENSNERKASQSLKTKTTLLDRNSKNISLFYISVILNENKEEQDNNNNDNASYKKKKINNFP